MNETVKGSAFLRIQGKPLDSGKVKFPVIKEYQKRKVCGIQLIPIGIIEGYYDASGLPNNKVFSFNSNYFVNLYDVKGYQFVTNAPIYLFSLPITTGLMQFKPRFLDWNLCNISFNGLNTTTGSELTQIMLNIYFA